MKNDTLKTEKNNLIAVLHDKYRKPNMRYKLFDCLKCRNIKALPYYYIVDSLTKYFSQCLSKCQSYPNLLFQSTRREQNRTQGISQLYMSFKKKQLLHNNDNEIESHVSNNLR